MKYVVVPEPVKLVSPLNNKPYTETGPDGTAAEIPPITLHGFLLRWVLSETEPVMSNGQVTGVRSKLGEGYEGVRRASKIDRLFESAVPGDIVGVEDADWTAVKKIIEEKEWPMPMVGARLVEIMDAWMAGATQDRDWYAKQKVTAESPAEG